MELFGWRDFHNRKQVGAMVGLTPTPHTSGMQERERGMSKAGNRDRHRRARTQASDRALALPRDRRRARGGGAQDGCPRPLRLGGNQPPRCSGAGDPLRRRVPTWHRPLDGTACSNRRQAAGTDRRSFEARARTLHEAPPATRSTRRRHPVNSHRQPRGLTARPT
ncbi:MAG: transposase [Myxococcota bacterium]